MAELIIEWAGKERLFRLTLGDVFDLEEACSDAVGAIFLRVTTGQFKLADVYHTIRLALVSGGCTQVAAKHLMETHFDRRPYAENAALAGEILIALMVGVEEIEKAEDESAEPQRLKFSEVSQICQTFNLAPTELRAMRYADFINMIRGYNASHPDQVAEPPTEAEFEDILARYEPEVLNG